MIKTVMWSESKALFITLAGKSLGKPKNGKPADFAEFIFSYPAVMQKKMYNFLFETARRGNLRDVTNETLMAEDCCLLSIETATAIEIMLRHLKTLNAGGRLKSLWCYLDTEKKAVVHFVNKGGWYAEAFFAANEDFSALHLLSEDGMNHFIPVVFAKDISKEVQKAGVTGGVFLHDYLPRVKGDLLSKKSHKSGKKQDEKPKGSRQNSGTHLFDNGDTL